MLVFDDFLKQQGFLQSGGDQCIYILDKSDVKTIIAVYVDDMVLVSSSDSEMTGVKNLLAGRF